MVGGGLSRLKETSNVRVVGGGLIKMMKPQVGRPRGRRDTDHVKGEGAGQLRGEVDRKKIK